MRAIGIGAQIIAIVSAIIYCWSGIAKIPRSLILFCNPIYNISMDNNHGGIVIQSLFLLFDGFYVLPHKRFQSIEDRFDPLYKKVRLINDY